MYYFLSKSEWDDPKSQLNEDKKKNWLKLFNFKEENMFKVHCSGHITPLHLLEMINTIKPKQIFPIHTLDPEKFHSLGLLPEIEIILPKKEKIYEL
jgi:mRNA degradation ribonuclease J1/J2